MALKKRATVQDGYAWRCAEIACQRWVSIRRNSFFYGSHISLVKWLHVIYFWSHDDSNHRIQHMSGLSNNTVGKMLKSLRSVCSNKIATNLIRIGGPGHIVEIDESKFGHKQKYHRGRFGEGPWVFGAIDRATKAAIVFRVPNRKRETLLPIMQRHILPGTTIHSDEFTPYRTLHNHGYIHLTVNHSENFVDPFTGVHTNTVEGLWSAVKRKLKRMNGTRYDRIPEYLDEFMWKRQFNQGDRFLAIIQDIAAGY